MNVDAMAFLAIYLVVPFGIWILWIGRKLCIKCEWKQSWSAQRVNLYVAVSGVLWILVPVPTFGLYLLFGFFPSLGVSRAIPIFIEYLVLALVASLMLRSHTLADKASKA
ncbi:TPA: hypothetical protein DCF80_01380 [Candidatus Saccharibacteria bacterium]|nr:hypothetical protein [Candidatus Saccharibacteria bacterium]HRK40964.1 hypothetical protein [Candidatus Saccharibacteria bacterium]